MSIKIYGQAELSGFIVPETEKFQSNFYPTITYQSFFSRYGLTGTEPYISSYEPEPPPIDSYYINVKRTSTPIVTKSFTISRYQFEVSGEYIKDLPSNNNNLSATVVVAKPKEYRNEVKLPEKPPEKQITTLGDQNDSPNVVVKFSDAGQFVERAVNKYKAFSVSQSVTLEFTKTVTVDDMESVIPTLSDITFEATYELEAQATCATYNISDLQFTYHTIPGDTLTGLSASYRILQQGRTNTPGIPENTTVAITVSKFGTLEKLHDSPIDGEPVEPVDILEGWIGPISGTPGTKHNFKDILKGIISGI